MNVKKLSIITGYLCLVGIALHIALSLYLVTLGRNPSEKLPLVTRLYKRVALPGPFFDERRIRFIPQFYIAYREKGSSEWSQYRNIERENFMRYHNSFFDYASLKRSVYERFTARKVSRRMKSSDPAKILSKPAFVELHRYLDANYLPVTTDSVRILYVVEEFQSDGHSKADTTFLLTYKSF